MREQATIVRQSDTERHSTSQPLPQHADLVEVDAPIPVRMPSGDLSIALPVLGLPKHPSFTNQGTSNKKCNSHTETQPRVYSPDFTFSCQTPEKAEALPRGQKGSHLEAVRNGAHAKLGVSPVTEQAIGSCIRNSTRQKSG